MPAAKDQQTEPAAAAPVEPAAAEAEAPAEQLSNEQLVRNQVEYYLSSKNLASDSYLVSKMDSNMWVPISVIANFKMIQSLIGTDENALLECMAESTIVLLNRESRCVRPNFKNERNTVHSCAPATDPIHQPAEINIERSCILHPFLSLCLSPFCSVPCSPFSAFRSISVNLCPIYGWLPGLR